MLESATILIVEDHPQDVLFLQTVIDRMPGVRYAVENTASLDEGLSRVEAGGIVLLMLDLGLPDAAGGVETFREAHSRCRGRVPILVFTATDDPSLAMNCLRAGAHDYLVKQTMSPDALQRSVRHTIENHRLQELAQRHERLAAIGTIAAGIAHEINNPASAALLSAESALALLELPDAKDDLRACLENIVTASQRCGRVVRNALQFCREERTERKPRNINSIVRKSRDLVRTLVEATNSRIQFELDASLPLVPVNELELEIVIVNLVKNAIEASEVPVHVVVRTLQRADDVEITISNDGPEMTPEQSRRALDPLYTSRRGSGGTGLGLSIVHGIVREHNGSLDIESKPGTGTTIRIRLPLIRDGFVGPELDCRLPGTALSAVA